MGTSYVKYRGFGFWSRDSFLEAWLSALIDEMRKTPNREGWQQSLLEKWEAQSQIGGGVIYVGLDEFLTDESKKEVLLAWSREALPRTAKKAQRTGELFMALLRGELTTTESSPINYL